MQKQHVVSALHECWEAKDAEQLAATESLTSGVQISESTSEQESRSTGEKAGGSKNGTHPGGKPWSGAGETARD